MYFYEEYRNTWNIYTLSGLINKEKKKNKATQTVGDSVPQEESVSDSECNFDSDDQSEGEVTEEEPDESYETESEESGHESEDDIEDSAERCVFLFLLFV